MKTTLKLPYSFKSKLHFDNALPSLKKLNSTSLQNILIFDQVLIKNIAFAKWIKQFDLSIGVQAGESLKTLKQYESVLLQLQLWQEKGKILKPIQVVALGGGSVGDFAGFVAATYKRGVSLVQIPSTWLSVIDSAHGGKTALNLNSVKNQIGVFYPAKDVFVCKQLLLSKNEERLIEACGEYIKIALINSPSILKNFQFSEHFIFKNLEKAIAGKMQVVLNDPFEKIGVRTILNLGHTMGHVYESLLGLSHGRAVLMGLIFSLRWSFYRKLLKHEDLLKFVDLIMTLPGCDQDYKLVKSLNQKKNLEKIKKVLLQDKKQAHKKIKFIFLKKIGKTQIELVTADEIVREFERQCV